MRKYKILFLCIELMFFCSILFIKVPCLFETIFNLSCPVCGISRTVKCIISLDFNNIFSYNILAVPILFLILIINIYLIYDIFNKTNKIYIFLDKMAKPIGLILLLGFIFNNIWILLNNIV